MNIPRLALALNEIGDDLLLDAASDGRERRSQWRRVGALAACLCLVVALALPVVRHKGGEVTQAVAALTYNGCCYEVVDAPEVLEKYGVTLTPDAAGRQVSYLLHDGASYRESVRETDAVLYEYAPAPCEAVYLLRDGEAWYAALFCNFEQSGNANSPLAELYRVYGMECAEDIASLAVFDWLENETVGATVTAREALAEFYARTTALESFGSDDFQSLTFSGVPDDAAKAAHTAFADDQVLLRIETTEGLRFYVAVYPSYGWLYAGGTQSYYRADDALASWLTAYLA